MQQDRLFFESVGEVLDYTIKALGGYKVVGSALKPERAPDVAGEWLRAALDRDKREKLGPEEVLLIVRMGRAKGVHAYAAYLATTADYAPPVPLTADDKKALQADAVLRAGAVIAEQFRQLQAMGIDFSTMVTGTVPAAVTNASGG